MNEQAVAGPAPCGMCGLARPDPSCLHMSIDINGWAIVWVKLSHGNTLTISDHDRCCTSGTTTASRPEATCLGRPRWLHAVRATGFEEQP